MGKRKIKWTRKAQIKFFQILDYYAERNKSKTYSTKLYKKITGQVKLLEDQPELGRITDRESIRGLIIDRYIVFYEIQTEIILIHIVWDGRQNPKKLQKGKPL